MNPNTIQRLESGLVAIVCIAVAVVFFHPWWWLVLAGFIIFDVSVLGYIRSTKIGAYTYNFIHNYIWPSILAVIALCTFTALPTVAYVCSLLALAWAFHVGVDRGLGFGLKLEDSFGHTHLGNASKMKGRP